MTGQELPVRSLSFELINELLDKYANDQVAKGAGPWERWSFCAGLMGAGIGLLVGTILGNTAGLFVLKAGLVVELAGFAVSLALMIAREWEVFRHAHKTYALELDHDYAQYQRFVDELRAFPLSEREARLRYIRGKKQVFGFRLGLFTGGIERLGVLPLLLGLYLQFKDWTYGDWEALEQVNLVQALLIWALLLCYALGWHLVRLKSRVDAFELLLAEANQTSRM